VSAADRGVLEDFMNGVLVDEYADVPVAGEGRSSAPRRAASIAVAAAIGLVVVVALIATLSSSDARVQARAALLQRIDAATGAIDARQATVDSLRARVDARQQDLLAAADAEPVAAQEAAALAARAATTELTGPGVTVTLDDAADAQSGSLNRVLDRDIQDVANALWQAGATGVSVNGQRLTGATAIRSAGDAVLVNYRPLNRPYEISAVGAEAAADPASPLAGLLAGLTGDYGLVTGVVRADVTLPGGEGRPPRYAQPRTATAQQTASGGSG
jgi:uncharacterized protein YlxW (UPF0749 family)